MLDIMVKTVMHFDGCVKEHHLLGLFTLSNLILAYLMLQNYSI